MGKILLIFLGTIFLIITGWFFLVNNLSNKKSVFVTSSNTNLSETVSKLPKTSPSPFSFQELTIPYLQNREYNSQLGELTKSYETGSYNAYLTSYDSDGLKINGLLTIPKGEEPEKGWPAIIFIHGYIPPSNYQTTQNYYDYVDYLAKNGFVVFKIDLRGHGSSEGEASGAYYSSDYIIDVLNAYSALQNSDFVNPEEIGLWGHSMAGNVVLRSIVAKKDIPAASIWAGAVYTYSDMSEFGIDDNSYVPPSNISERQRKRQALRDTYGEFDPDNSFWKQVAPTNYLNGLETAIQLNHAVNDNVVNIGYSRNLDKLLEDAKVEHELKEYGAGGHNINGSAFNEAMQNTVNFFKTYLK